MSNVSSCPSSVKPRRSPRRRSKVVYRVRNWADYEAGLQQRGSLTVWCTPQAVQDWYYQGPPQRGAQYTFSEVAIQTALTLRLLYHLPLRQTEGFVASVLALMGLDLRVPDHTTLSRRQAGLAIAWPPQRGDEPMHLVVDSTGLKVYGEGEWKVRQHGWSKRRTWRKLPLGVDEATGEIVAQTLTPHSQDDAGQVEPLPRDETIRVIRKRGRRGWKHDSGYHRRSVAETQIGRYKQILGDTLRTRTLTNQQTEARLGCALLNRLRALAKPESYPIDKKA